MLLLFAKVDRQTSGWTSHSFLEMFMEKEINSSLSISLCIVILDFNDLEEIARSLSRSKSLSF